MTKMQENTGQLPDLIWSGLIFFPVLHVLGSGCGSRLCRREPSAAQSETVPGDALAWFDHQIGDLWE